MDTAKARRFVVRTLGSIAASTALGFVVHAVFLTARLTYERTVNYADGPEALALFVLPLCFVTGAVLRWAYRVTAPGE